MSITLPRLLFAIVAGLITVDLAWAAGARFQLDVPAYSWLALVASALMAGAIFYSKCRAEPQIAAMLGGTSFLSAFSGAASVLNCFLLTLHGPRIDSGLAAADRALGFDWLAMMTILAGHPHINSLLRFCYGIVLPEIALIVILLGRSGNARKIYRFCLAIALAALISIFIWALAPSFGAMSIYQLPPAIARAIAPPVDGIYGNALAAMLRDGPGFISPSNMHGLIGFPSLHGALALILTWYARSLPRLFWPLLVLNGLVLVATPSQGGHHMIDVLASFPLASLAVFLSSLPERGKSSAKFAGMVNKPSSWAIKPHVSRILGATLIKD